MRPAQLKKEKSNLSNHIFTLVVGRKQRCVSIVVKRTEMSFSGLFTDSDSHSVVRITHALGSKKSQRKLLMK